MTSEDQTVTEQTNKELSDIQKPRRVSNKVGLGLIHDDLQKLNTTLNTLPKADRNALPPVVFSMGGQKLDPRDPRELDIIKRIQASNPDILKEMEQNVDPTTEKVSPKAKEEAPEETDAERTARLIKIGNVIQEKQGLGTANQTVPEIGKSVFDKFVEQTKNREDLLADATKEQTDLFKRLEETIISLRDANVDENRELRKTLAELSGQLEASPETATKEQLTTIIKEAKAAAKPTLGQRVMGKAEAWIESKRSPAFDELFRSAKVERKAEIGGILESLTGKAPQQREQKPKAATATPTSKVPGWAKALSTTALAPKVASSTPMVPSLQLPETISIENIDTLNVKAKNVSINGEDLQGDDIDIGFGGKRSQKGTAKVPPKGTAKGKAAPRLRDAKGRFAKAPAPKASMVGRFGGKALGAAGAGLSGYLAYKENLQRGTGTAATIGAATGGGALAGAAAGAALGTMVMPGVGTVVGGLIGGGLGAWGAQEASEAVADAVAVPEVTPVQNLQGPTIVKNSTTNNELKRTESKPIVVVPPSPAPIINQSSSPVLLPKGNIRPSENAFERYVNRSTSFV